jgi:hypothetical protein
MATQVSICNMALARFGNVTIADIDENTKESRACKAAWDTVRDELLEAHSWRFAIKRYEFGTYLSTVPTFPDDHYYYELPAACLRVLELWQAGAMSDAEWSIEDENKLLCNLDEDVQIRYIARVTDVSKYGPAFAACFACSLAAVIGPKLTSNPKLRLEYLNELSLLISKAEKLNAIEGNPTKHKDEQALDKGNFSWQTEGR